MRCCARRATSVGSRVVKAHKISLLCCFFIIIIGIIIFIILSSFYYIFIYCNLHDQVGLGDPILQWVYSILVEPRKGLNFQLVHQPWIVYNGCFVVSCRPSRVLRSLSCIVLAQIDRSPSVAARGGSFVCLCIKRQPTGCILISINVRMYGVS